MSDVMEETSAVDLVCEYVGPLAIRGDRWAQGVMASLTATPADEQEAYARLVCETIGRVLEAITSMMRPYVKAALADRRIRATEVLAEEGHDLDELEGEHVIERDEPLTRPWRPRRFLLLEKNQRSEPPYYLGTFDSVEAAGAYHWGQEYYADWAIELIVDLDTGDRYEVEQKFIATKIGAG
jgi:hypothetical protein